MTYFVTYGTAMACYAYFVLTKEDYLLPDVSDRQFLLGFHRRARKGNWDVARYNVLKEGIARVEHDLQRLRDPLSLRLPRAPGEDPASDIAKGILGGQMQIGNIRNMLKEKFSSA